MQLGLELKNMIASSSELGPTPFSIQRYTEMQRHPSHLSQWSNFPLFHNIF